MKRGFSKTYRRELESDIWKMPPIYQRVFFFLRLKVKYKAELFPTKKGYGVWLNPGQWLTSINNIASGVAWHEWGVEKIPNKKVIKDVLVWLKSNDMILVESNAYGTYVELLNWGLYNDRDLEKVTIDNQEEVTRRGEDVDTIKELKKELKELKEKNSSSKKLKPPKPEPKIFPSDSNEFRLASLLFKLKRKNNPNCKEDNLQIWAKTFDLAIRMDQRKIKDLEAMVRWTQKDSFWHKNILSAAAIRRQFDQLTLKMKEDDTTSPFGVQNEERPYHQPVNLDFED